MFLRNVCICLPHGVTTQKYSMYVFQQVYVEVELMFQPLNKPVPNCVSMHFRIIRKYDDNSPPSSAEVKEEYELYLLSPQAPPWRVVRPHYFYFTLENMTRISSYFIRYIRYICNTFLSDLEEDSYILY
jgi:hypothetical protein